MSSARSALVVKEAKLSALECASFAALLTMAAVTVAALQAVAMTVSALVRVSALDAVACPAVTVASLLCVAAAIAWLLDHHCLPRLDGAATILSTLHRAIVVAIGDSASFGLPALFAVLAVGALALLAAVRTIALGLIAAAALAILAAVRTIAAHLLGAVRTVAPTVAPDLGLSLSLNLSLSLGGSINFDSLRERKHAERSDRLLHFDF